MIRNISVILTVALLTTVVNSGGAFAVDDRKSVSGVACAPKNLSQAADFRYGKGAIINRSTNRRKVVCSILRDRFDGDNAVGEIDNVAVFVVRSDSTALPLSCVFIVRNLETGAVLISSTASTSVAGPAILDVATDLDYGTPPLTPKTGTDNAIYELICTLPGKSRVKGIRYEEDAVTDGEPE